MWEQYKKTFWAIQVVIVIAAIAVLVWSHLVALAALFFCTMQLSAVLGGLWAGRLKRKFGTPVCQPRVSA